MEDEEYTLCLFCEVLHKVDSKVAEIYKVLENVRKEIGEVGKGS